MITDFLTPVRRRDRENMHSELEEIWVHIHETLNDPLHLYLNLRHVVHVHRVPGHVQHRGDLGMPRFETGLHEDPVGDGAFRPAHLRETRRVARNVVLFPNLPVRVGNIHVLRRERGGE